MSLVELVIALGIGAIVATVSISFSRNLALVQRNIITMTDVASIGAEFNNEVNRITDCNSLFPTLPGTPVGGFNLAAATSAAGMPISIQLANRDLTDGTFIGSHMRVQSVRFQMPNPGSRLNSYNAVGTAAYTGVIHLRVQKTMEGPGGTAIEEQTFGPLVLRVNAANQIEHCVGLQSPEYQCITSITDANIWNIGTNTCVPPAPCPAQLLSWTVSSTCSANFPAQAPGSVSSIVTDSTLPALGSAAFTCDLTGTWNAAPEAGAICTTTVCPPQLLSWTVGAETCSANFPAQIASSISPSTPDATLPTLGSAAFTCDATGTWNGIPEAGATCSLLTCPAQALSWTVGPNTCSANFFPTAASSISPITSDSTLPGIGSAAFTCDATGAWLATPEVGATCTTTTCPGVLLSWTLGADTCSANFPVTASSSISPPSNDSTLPTLGSAAFTCDAGGTWSVTPQPGATCTTSVCPAQSLSWTVGPNTCNANFPTTAAGAIEVRGDLISPNEGYAAFRCNAGTWSVTPEASSPTPSCSPSPTALCYMTSQTVWWDPFDCDSTAIFRKTLAACMAALETPTACNVTPTCTAVYTGNPMAVYCPP